MSLVEHRAAALPVKSDDPMVEIEIGIRRQIRLGMVIVIGFFLFAGLWLALAPLNSGAYATGQIIAETRRKAIQHLEGGIIDEVLVHDGSRVNAGDVLLRMRPTQARANVEILSQRLTQNEALRTRLLAERDDLKAIQWPASLRDQAQKNPDIADLLKTQEQVFMSRRRSFIDQLAVLEQRNVQANESIRGLEAQIKSRRIQGGLLDEEITTVRTLLESGNAQRPRLLALQRNRADIDSMIASLQSNILQTREKIGETNLQTTSIRSDRTREIVSQLRDVEADIADTRERLNAAQDILDRIDILAPQAGVIVNVKAFSQGQVIRPGEAIMELVPVNDAMIISVRIRPEDIDVVHAEMMATVRLTAFSRKLSMPLTGTVTYVSADASQDERTGMYYYTAHVKVPPEEVKKINEKALIPGSPASVMVETGERTAFEYLFAPFVQAWDRAFRED